MAVLATLVIFLIANTVPGDPVLAQLGDLAASNKEFVADWRAKWGLDLPLWERYSDLPAAAAPRRSRHLDRLAAAGARGHRATTRRRPSNSPRIAFLLSSSIGIPLGILAAVRRDSWIDHLARLHLADRRVLADVLAGLHHARGLLRRAADRAGPGRIDSIALPPPSVTGLYLIDSVLAGDWETFRDALAHWSCRRSCWRRDARPDHAHHAREHAGELRQDYVRVARAKGSRERASCRAQRCPTR